ncbi:RRN10 (YBL025W) [Zygosaccharomyces parabailii]|nr:RRN10 (YBL025W) [Zygosaccharomyces parabailii]CDH15260.1 probable RNA polymerase I-specific transcription initiation factor RRN10 [Zygosaccharomyces bailii ISA1307]SJM87285.1 probable RNA polymerase I-specific transcription initiation factor RRN10 [Zygosaccharomyces bailii]
MDRTVYEACSDLIVDYGTHVVSADEVLGQKVGGLVPIPFKSREELERASEKDRNEGLFQGELMPRIDLKVLHYFATQLCLQKYPQLAEAFDETSLICLGSLVEQWVKDYLVSAQMGDQDDEKLGPGPSQALEKAINYRDSPANI